MFKTARYDSEANRFAPHTDYIDFEGFDFTSAVCKLQIRDRKNGGQLRADVTPSVSVSVVEGTPVSRLSWTIPEVTMEAMPLHSELDDDVALQLDLHITPSGAPKFVAVRGTFIVRAGVTE